MFDKIAIGGRSEMLLLSVFTQGQRAKAIRAMLSGGAGRISIEATGVYLKKSAEEFLSKSIGSVRISPSEDGYYSFIEKRDYGLCHVLFISYKIGFMPVVDDTAIWKELKSDRFTTPILREWMPHIQKQLMDRSLLRMCWQHRCQCAVIDATSDQLDDIVSSGLKTRKIEIPGTRIDEVEFSLVEKTPLATEYSGA